MRDTERDFLFSVTDFLRISGSWMTANSILNVESELIFYVCCHTIYVLRIHTPLQPHRSQTLYKVKSRLMSIHTSDVLQWIILTTVHPDALRFRKPVCWKTPWPVQVLGGFSPNPSPKAQRYPNHVCYNSAASLSLSNDAAYLNTQVSCAYTYCIHVCQKRSVRISTSVHTHLL